MGWIYFSQLGTQKKEEKYIHCTADRIFLFFFFFAFLFHLNSFLVYAILLVLSGFFASLQGSILARLVWVYKVTLTLYLIA